MKSRDSAGKALLCVLSRQPGHLLCCVWEELVWLKAAAELSPKDQVDTA